MENLTIITGNAKQALCGLDTVDLVVTSPPYDDLRTYSGYEFDFESITVSLSACLKPGGVICWIIGAAVVAGSETLTPFKQAIFFVEMCGLRLHDTMIYKKLNFSHPEKTRYHQTFEYVFVFSKGPPKTFNPLMDRSNKTAGVGNLGINTFTKRDGSKSVRAKQITKDFGMRHNVWEGKTRGQEDMCEVLPHPAMMPKWLARDLILSFSNEGDTVLDPFLGSGTTAQAALAVGRKVIGIEINPEYAELAKQRCKGIQELAMF